MPQSKNKYTLFRKKTKRKRKKGGAASSPTPEDLKNNQLIDYALGNYDSNSDYKFDFEEEIPPTSRKNSPKIWDFISA